MILFSIFRLFNRGNNESFSHTYTDFFVVDQRLIHRGVICTDSLITLDIITFFLQVLLRNKCPEHSLFY